MYIIKLLPCDVDISSHKVMGQRGLTEILRIIYTAWLLGGENIIVHGNHKHVEEYHYLLVAVQMSPS